MMNYILSLKRSPKDGAAVWFLPDKRGYTTDLNKAVAMAMIEYGLAKLGRKP